MLENVIFDLFLLFFNLYSFNDYEVLDKKTYEFIYIKYNYLRPHSFNNGIPPALSKWSA